MRVLSILGVLIGLAIIGLVFTGGLDYIFYSAAQKESRSIHTANTSNAASTIIVQPTTQSRPEVQATPPNTNTDLVPTFVGKRLALVIGNSKI